MRKKLPTTIVIEIMESRGNHLSPKYKKYIRNYISNTPKLKLKLDEEKFEELAEDMEKVIQWRNDLDFC
jgi:hypothetical protein